MNNEYSIEYETIKWRASLDDAYILHTLAVHPHYLRQSYAKQLLTFCINKAINDHKKHICLDVYEYSEPPPLIEVMASRNHAIPFKKYDI